MTEELQKVCELALQAISRAQKTHGRVVFAVHMHDVDSNLVDAVEVAQRVETCRLDVQLAHRAVDAIAEYGRPVVVWRSMIPVLPDVVTAPEGMTPQEIGELFARQYLGKPKP